MTRALVFIVSVAALAGGCSGGEALRGGWNDFQAYYNTFYNAKEYFNDGQKAIRDQPRSLNPELPVRVHPAPLPAGKESFEQAIEKSSRVMRNHPESDWVDDALLLMGKSYYYLQDYAAAIKWLEQLQDFDASPSIQGQAVIWKGRAMLDLGVHSQGIAYLEEILGDFPPGWSLEDQGELQVLAAEHHAMLENWEQASDLVTDALSALSNRNLRGAAFFFNGQLLERQDRLGEAYYAYTQVPSHFIDSEYDYWARFKQADVSRKQGNLETALLLYRQLQNNDKYVERREQLEFEIARTLEMQGRFKEAERHYRELLYGDRASELRTLQADLHYHLGRILSDNYQNYPAAAAHYDTSASLRSTTPSEDEEAAVLADAYGQYTDLKQSIQRADSLLRLGSMSPEKLDAFLEKTRERERQRLLRQQEEEQENRLINQPALPDEADTTNRSAIYGFLNHRSNNLVDRAKNEFRIIWGRRPLADDWRRREAVGEAAGNRQERADQTGDTPGGEEAALSLELNTDAIPRTDAERTQLKTDRAAYRYQLGNVLFLNLDEPDSARVYYHKVIKDEYSPSLHPRAMYALYEIFRTMNRPDSLRYWAARLADEYPDSEYARLAGQEDEGAVINSEGDSSRSLKDRFHLIMASREPSSAERLRSLAMDHRSTDLAPHIHFKAIEEYIDQARTDQWIADELLAGLFASDRGAVAPFGLDTGSFIFKEPAYTTASWDHVRTLLTEHEAFFESSPYRENVQKLMEELSSATN